MAETWMRMRSLFEEAVELEASEQGAFLDRACGGDSALRAAVEELLRIDREAGDFIERPLVPEADGEAAGGAYLDNHTPYPVVGPSPGEKKSPEDRRDLDVEDEPTRLGPYRVLRRIGQGGLGTVYLAVRDDDTFERRVVVKLVRRDVESAELQRRLRTERQILASLRHPHIAELYDGGTTDDGRPFFVMEFIEGVPIDAYCDQHRLSVDERLALFAEVCSAVHYAHQNLVVHRDLKPSNILVTADGEPKLLDFGIAKLLNPELAHRELDQTATWLRLMTPHYASPEQVRGKLVGTSSDVYSLGVLLYRLLTGRLPHRFERRSPAEIERILTETDPQRPSTAVSEVSSSTSEKGSREGLSKAPDASTDAAGSDRLPSMGTDLATLRRQLSGDLDAIVLKALRSAPQQRYSSAERFAADIDRYRRGLSVEARQGNWRYRAVKFLRRNRLAVATAAAVVILVLVAGGLLIRQSTRVAAERDRVTLERQRKQAVLDTMLDVLKVADPYAEGGASFTVREALESSEGRLRHRLRDQPDLLAEVFHTTSEIYMNLGLWERAKAQAEEALRLRSGLYGDGAESVAETRSQLASILAELGEVERATELSAEAVEVLKAAEPAGSSEALVDALNTRVTVLCYAGDYESAAEPSLEALGLARDRAEQNLPALADALANRAVLQTKAEEFAAAAELYRESLGLLEIWVGSEHPTLTPLRNNLGSVLRRGGRLAEAEQMFAQVLEDQRRTLGEDHVDLAFTLNNLGRVQLEKGDLEGAGEHYRAALELFARHAGKDHPRVLFLELNLATALLRSGESAAVIAHLEGILPAWRERLGADHAFVTDAESLLESARSGERSES